jgi:hypothetical protein
MKKEKETFVFHPRLFKINVNEKREGGLLHRNGCNGRYALSLENT